MSSWEFLNLNFSLACSILSVICEMSFFFDNLQTFYLSWFLNYYFFHSSGYSIVYWLPAHNKHIEAHTQHVSYKIQWKNKWKMKMLHHYSVPKRPSISYLLAALQPEFQCRNLSFKWRKFSSFWCKNVVSILFGPFQGMIWLLYLPLLLE